MPKTNFNGATPRTHGRARYTGPGLAEAADAAGIRALASAALGRLRQDLESYKPDQPAIIYALVSETHDAILHEWELRQPEQLTALLTALQDETLSLARRFHAESAQMAPSNCYMFGLQEDSIRLEIQADIVHEELLRIEADLRQRGQMPPLQ